MEKIDKILEFVKDIGYGDGLGEGSGIGIDNIYGYGYGYGDGLGEGLGYNNGSGYGSGYGDGSGYGSGYDNGSGSGAGYGLGYGYRLGQGYGLGDGYSDGDVQIIKSINGEQVFYLDEVPTIIDHIRNNVAIGRIINENDYLQTKCYIVKQNGQVAHEKTLKDALATLQQKIFASLNTEQRIKEFRKEFNNKSKYLGKKFFEWHNILTGSCLAGRENFINSRGLSLEKRYSVKEFIAICENAFGGEIIQELKQYYK